MILAWDDILPKALAKLPSVQRDIVRYVVNLPGKRKPSSKHILEQWRMSRPEFNVVLGFALDDIRRYLRRRGLTGLCDLKLEDSRPD